MLLAARGQRDLDGGVAAIGDANELAQVRRQGRQVRLQTAIAAVVITAVSMLLP